MAAPVRPAGVNQVPAEIPDCFFPWQSDRTRCVTDRAEASQAAAFGLVGVCRNCSLARPPGCETGGGCHARYLKAEQQGVGPSTRPASESRVSGRISIERSIPPG